MANVTGASGNQPYDKNEVYDALAYYSALHGVPTYITSSIVELESNFDPYANGDGGASYGLLQLYTRGGQGDAYKDNPTQLYDIYKNLEVGMKPIATAYKQAKEDGYKEGYQMLERVAGTSGHPSYNMTFTNGYKDALKRTFNNGDELKNHSFSATSVAARRLFGSNAPFLKDEDLPPMATKDVKRTKISDTMYQRAISMGLTLTSGYRDPQRNDNAGGSKTSNHLKGLAYDFGGKPELMSQFYRYAKPFKDSGELTELLYSPLDGVSDDHHDHVHIAWPETNGVLGFVEKIKDAIGYDQVEAGSFALFETIDRWSQFDDDFSILAPFEYVMNNAKAFSLRLLFTLIGIIIFVFGFLMIIKNNGKLDAMADERDKENEETTTEEDK